VFDHSRHFHCQSLSDNVLRRPLSNCRLPPVVAKLIVDQSVVCEKREQPLKIEGVGCLDIGGDRCASTAKVSGGWEDVGITVALQSRLTEDRIPLTMTDGPWQARCILQKSEKAAQCEKAAAREGGERATPDSP
jgi:hypothetical protein